MFSLQGYNNVIVYSRAFYFCLLALLLITVDAIISRYNIPDFTLYDIQFASNSLLLYTREVLKGKKKGDVIANTCNTCMEALVSQAGTSREKWWLSG